MLSHHGLLDAKLVRQSCRLWYRPGSSSCVILVGKCHSTVVPSGIIVRLWFKHGTLYYIKVVTVVMNGHTRRWDGKPSIIDIC